MSELLRYTRVVRTADGGSAFEDAEVHLGMQRVASGTPPMLVGDLSFGGAAVFLRGAEFDSEPHPAPTEQWVLMLRGAIEIEVSDGSRRRFAPGDLVLVTDTTGRGHVTFARGEPPLEALFLPVA